MELTKKNEKFLEHLVERGIASTREEAVRICVALVESLWNSKRKLQVREVTSTLPG